MMWWSIKLNKKYAFDCLFFHLRRAFKDDIDFFELKLGVDLYEGDHNPQWQFYLIILNFTIFEFVIYNMFHKDRING